MRTALLGVRRALTIGALANSLHPPPEADGVRSAPQASHQLSLNPLDDRPRRIEAVAVAVAVQARARCGAAGIGPASPYGAA
ncbi:hypothetical protein [Kitasatospora indigofera]|uniref:hypothetical protein n=1 Tax=Kitasatospora indigofera TaxID=67307 RepID=UPI00362BE826